jgi:hypothetical protein
METGSRLWPGLSGILGADSGCGSFCLRGSGDRLGDFCGASGFISESFSWDSPVFPGKIETDGKKVGIFEYAVILAISVFGIARGEALGYAVMLQVVEIRLRIRRRG